MRRLRRFCALARLEAALASELPPQRFKGEDFDLKACQEACDVLAASVAQGNHHHVEGLVTALRLMMPAQSGAERAFGRPREDFVLRPEVLTWSSQDFLGGLEERAESDLKSKQTRPFSIDFQLMSN